MKTALLKVNNLKVNLYTEHAAVRPVDGVSYSVAQSETVAIVGESGCGKTVMNFAPLGLMPTGVSIDVKGSIRFDGQELVGMSEHGLRLIRGKLISTIFQDPMSALNPSRLIGRQIAEVSELHLGHTTKQAEAWALDLVKLVGISDPEYRMKQYPHELSGGLCQRVMIAIAIAAEPKLLIADEPSTALDVTVQAQILKLLKDIQMRLNMAMVIITHDIGVVAGNADHVAVMYAGRIAEYGPVEEVLVNPKHPYTKGLISAIPRSEDPIGSPFRGLSGMPPYLEGPIRGCGFSPRCTAAIDRCSTSRPSFTQITNTNVLAACHIVNQSESQGAMN